MIPAIDAEIRAFGGPAAILLMRRGQRFRVILGFRARIPRFVNIRPANICKRSIVQFGEGVRLIATQASATPLFHALVQPRGNRISDGSVRFGTLRQVKSLKRIVCIRNSIQHFQVPSVETAPARSGETAE